MFLAFFWGDARPEVPPRGLDQGDLVIAMLRYFRPRIVSEEGSCACGCSASSVSLRFRAVSSSATRPPVGGEAHEAILDAPGHAVLVEVANPSPSPSRMRKRA